MPEKQTAPSRTPKHKTWLGRILRGLGWTLLALLLLHWPLIIFGVPVLARLAAQQQHLNVSLGLSGTLWTNLTVTNLRATPDGSGATPVEKISIDRLRLDYSLWRLATRGIGEFLSSYEVHQADLRFLAQPSQTQEEKEVKKSVAETLRTILAQPAAYSDRVLIDDFSISVRSAEAETAVQHISVLFDPHKPGYLRIARMQIPGLPLWENLSAETSYIDRNLIQRGLHLGPDIVIDELNYDASKRAEGKGRVALLAHIFGGEVKIVLTGEEKGEKGDHLAKAYDTHLQISIAGVRVHDAAAYFGVQGIPVERLSAFELDFTGDPEKPRTWEGSVRTVIENLAAGSVTVPKFELNSQFTRGTASSSAVVALGGNQVALQSTIALPERIDDFVHAGIDATARIDAPDLPTIAAAFAPQSQMGGKVGLEARIGLHDRRATVQATLNVKDTVFDQVSAPSIAGQIHASTMVDPDWTVRLQGLDAGVDLTTGPVQIGTFGIDSTRVVLDVAKGLASLQQLTVQRGTNSIGATARVHLPEVPGLLPQSAGEIQASIQAPALEEFGIVANGKPLRGKIETQVRAQFAEGRAEGDVQLAGNVALGQFQTQRIAATVRMRGDQVQLDEFTVALSDSDRLTAKGQYRLPDPRDYQGTLALGFRDLAVLQPLLDALGVQVPIKGALDVTWTGKGLLSAVQHEGEASILIKGANVSGTPIDEFRLGARYTAESADANLLAVSGPTRFKTDIAWANDVLKLAGLELRQGDLRALQGEITYGLPRPGGAAFDPLKQPLKVSLDADKLDLAKVFDSLKQKAPATGTVSLHLAATGTPARPELELTAAGRTLKAASMAKLDPADFDLAVRYVPGSVKVEATARQPLIQPLEIRASAPLDLEKVLAEKKVDPQLPIQASVKLPSSSLAVLPKLTPEVRRIEGTVALDVKVSGPMEKPQIGGDVTVALRNARLANESVPAIGSFDARLVFGGDTLKFERFKGEVGGGTFELGGSIGLADTKNPSFNLQMKADKILAHRDDSITIRADADVKVAGALEAATVSGNVYVVQSRFFKEIDILPIGLPGKPKPAPKSAPGDVNISLPPPLDRWKFDLGIKTREDDPFLVRGNLANGRVGLNLTLGGEGKQPYLEGTVTIEQFTGSLPFSQLQVENGHVYFTKAAPFQPTLDIQSISKIRDYTVTAYVFGSATEPQLQLTSEPPLPHADIVALIATGTTTSEISGNADLLASRAAIFAVENLYRKLFKKKAPPKEAAPRDDANFANRFEFEFGGLDQKTGAREANARFKITDTTYIIGEFDTRGGYTGSLKYLLRFR